MKRVIFSLIAAMLFAANVSAAVIITGTSFENEYPSGDGRYYHDVNDADHDMDNWAGVIVDSTQDSVDACDLGFDAYFYDVNDPAYIQTTAEYDYLGVTDYTPIYQESMADGNQAYQLQDADGKIQLTFDTVNVTGMDNVWVLLDLFVKATSWETAGEGTGFDAIDIKLQTDAGNVQIVDPNVDPDFSGLEGKWTTLTGVVPAGATQAALVASLTCNAASEAIWIDHVRFIVGATDGPNESTSWEDFILTTDLRGILDEYPTQGIDQSISNSEANTGSKSLKVGHEDVSGTPQAYLAWINDLQIGDVVTARFYAKNGVTDGNNIRIWGHWTDNNDMENYEGSAGGNAKYSGNDWTELIHSWTVTDANATGLAVEARVYLDNGDFGYVDDLTVWAPAHANITLPEASGYYCETRPEYDFNKDCKTDLTDFAMFALDWMSCTRYPSTECEE